MVGHLPEGKGVPHVMEWFQHRRRGKQGADATIRIVATIVMLAGALLATSSLTPRSGAAQETIALEAVTGGLDSPVQVTHAGDGSNRLFVVERSGRIRVITNGELAATPFLDLTDRVLADGEQGLLSVAFHPEYETNGQLFVLYTAKDWANTVERFTVTDDPNVADPSSGEVVLAIPDRQPNHNGGTLLVGTDGMLYISTGDEGGGGDPYGNAQNLGSLYGKILRIDIDSGDPYAIPGDNPFIDDADARGEVWAYGLRNPWRFSFDRETNDLWIADVGQSALEEVNFVPAGTGAGRNFGWNAMEGTQCYEGECDPSLYTLPVAEYTHDDGCSITGGHVYRGSDYPALTGKYFFGDFCSGMIWSLSAAGVDWTMTLELETSSWITSFGEDEAGELYLTDLAGVVYQVTTTSTSQPDFAAPAIERTWNRTDAPVRDLAADRTWMWGPEPLTGEMSEPYVESPGGARLVQYFDKSRMEITYPDAHDDGVWYVTNGLLVVEMIEGFFQIGDVDRNEAPPPAEVSIAGDLGQHVTYAYVARHQLRSFPAREPGTLITEFANPNGIEAVTEGDLPEQIFATQRVTVDGIDHTVASVFWEFMNSSGLIEENGELITGPLFQSPFYATGLPITEAYWTTVAVDGVEQSVLFQCFERRCLTYTPGNEPGWQVEAGNVGLHYYLWRYGEQ